MENILFRQTFRGFDRRQVLEYIDNISAQMAKQAEEYENIQKGLEEKIHTLSRQLSQSEDNLSLSREAREKLAEELEYLKENNADLKKRVGTYRNMILERDREISQIKVSYNKLSDHSRQLEKENADWKSKQDEIASVMVEANVRAKQIIDAATQQARRTKAEFDSNAANLMEKVADVKGEIGRLEQQLEETFAKLSVAMENMDKASEKIENQVNEYREKVDKIDNFTPALAEETQREESARSQIPGARAVAKKTLTESVLDTITKLLEK